MLGLVCFAVGLLGQAAPRSVFTFVDPDKDIVVTSKQAYVLMPPELISAQTVIQPEWSSNGRYLLFARSAFRPYVNEALQLTNSPEEEPIDVMLWDSGAHKSSQIAVINPSDGIVEDLTWLHGEDVAFLTIRQILPVGLERTEPVVHYTMYRIVPGRRQPEVLFKDDGPVGGGGLAVDASPAKPLAFIFTYRELKDHQYHQLAMLLTQKGSRLVEIQKGELDGAAVFGPSGSPLFVTRDPEGTPGARKRRVFPIDPLTGALGGEIPFPGPLRSPVETGPLILEKTKVGLSNDKLTASTTALWLRSVSGSEQPRAFITADSDESGLSPATNAVHFVSKGSLFVRELKPFSLESYMLVKLEHEKRQAMNRAKQVGLGLLLFASDYDDKLPRKAEFPHMLEPYLKDSTTMNGFVYQLDGNLTSKIEDPAKTTMGYIETGTGRAIVYADGHVVWIPKP